MSDTHKNDLNNELILALNKCLTENKTDDVLMMVRDPKYERCIKDNSWDLIPLISKFLRQETLDSSPDVYECCNTILEEIAHKANPEEAFLEFLEQAEDFENDVKFLALLEPLKTILFKLPKRRGQSLEWCLNMIQSHVAALPEPGNYGLEGSERNLMDCDSSVIRIIKVYKGIISCYEPFVKEIIVKSKKESLEDSRTNLERSVLICFLLQLLGKPLALLDLQHNDTSCSAVLSVVENLMSCITNLLSDPMVFLEYAELREEGKRFKRRSNTVKVSEDVEGSETQNIMHSDTFTREDKIPTLSIAVFYYILLAEQICIDKIPCVYSKIYVFEKCMNLIVMLLKCPEEFIIQKGLLLAKSLLSPISDESIPHGSLCSPAHKEFVESLTVVMVYCEVEEMRKTAVSVLKSYLFKFTLKGQYLLMSHLPEVVNHSGVLGYLIMQLKDMIMKSLDVNVTYFMGKHLNDLIWKYCSLQHGAETDLVESVDQIISSLNLMRFLVLRDRENRTGIWDNIDGIQKSFLNPLREGIKLSRAHYKLKLKDLEEEKKASKGNDDKIEKSEVAIRVGGLQLPDLPYENKVNVIDSALNAFDLMESLLIRVTECIECEKAKL